MWDYDRKGFCEGLGTVWNTLKGGGTEKSGEETEFKKEGAI